MQRDREVPANSRHFGLTVREGTIHELRVNRATYTNVSRTVSSPGFHLAAIERGQLSFEDAAEKFVDPRTCREYTETYVQALEADALRNFDLNMMYFERIKELDFRANIAGMLEAFPGLEPVSDLVPWMGKPGVYIMVLDDYRQMYVGQSARIGRRIRQHWTNSKRLDRLVFGSAEGSVLSVDSFRALDTTRIYARTQGLGEEMKRYAFEAQLVLHIDPRLSLNRIAGGQPIDALETERLTGMKSRDLAATAEEWAAYWAKLEQTQMGRELYPRGYRRESAAQTPSTREIAEPEDGDLIRLLLQEANDRRRGSTLLVDAGGTLIRVQSGSVSMKADKYVQLFMIPCGMNISREQMEAALAAAPRFIGTELQPPLALFDKLSSSGVVVRGSER